MSIDHDQRWRARALFALQALAVGCAPETVPAASAAHAAPPKANPLGGETAFAEAEGASGAEESPVTAVRYLSSVNQPVPPKERVAWPHGAKSVPVDKLGSITGEVYDAVTDKPIALGTVETAAPCTGAGCASASAVSAGKTIAMLSSGVFVFDAHAASPAKLALEGDSAFTISATGYETIVFAHGPHGSAAASDGKAVTKFPRLYGSRVAAMPDSRRSSPII